jgi:hypothetical protein
MVGGGTCNGMGVGLRVALCWARVRARREGGKDRRVECRPLRQASRWPKDVAREREGLRRTIVAVRRGIDAR